MAQYSIYAWFGFPLPFRERIRLIKAVGFDGVLLWWGDESGRADGGSTTPFELACQAGLMVENIHTPFQDINSIWTDNLAGERVASILQQCIADCGTYAVPTAVIHVTQSNDPPPPNQIGLDRFKRLVELAERHQVNLALENLRRPEYLEWLFSRIDSERLGFCYDSGHANCYGRGRDLLTQYGAKLMALHLHDNDGISDSHQIPGAGTIDWEILMAKIRQTGYSGPIALETIRANDNGETAGQYLQRAFQAAGRLGEANRHEA
jgi:L-ribulose-5-phosphate 3-epimerase